MSPLPPPFGLARTVHGTGPGLLLAHGAGGSIELNYGPLVGGLAEHHTVVCPDYPGSGDTPRANAPLSLNGLADSLVATAVDAGVESFAISGYSLGGAVAVRAAVRHPQRVTALILTATFARPNARLLLLAHLWKQLLLAGEDDRLASFLALVGFSPTALDQMRPPDLDAVLRSGTTNIPQGTPEHLELLAQIDIRRDLPTIRVPTLVVSTTRDTLVTPHHHEELARGIPGAKFVAIDAGHLLVQEHPHEWLAAISDFLSGP